MTEADWLASTDPMAMLREFLPPTGHRLASDRKLRLFACACGRRLARNNNNFFGTDRAEVDRLIGEMEDHADGGKKPVFSPGSYLNTDAVGAAKHCVALRISEFAALLRDLFNPWRPVHLVPGHRYFDWLAWNDNTVPRLAEAIYEGRRLEDVPILADALEEAGCENEELLRHCRGWSRCPVRRERPGYSLTLGHFLHSDVCDLCNGTGWAQTDAPHVRGCWALDLLLGKE